MVALKPVALTAVDLDILQALAGGVRPVKDFTGKHPRATVYRRLRKLCAEGLVARSSLGFTLTSVGERMLAEREAEVLSEGLRAVYAPLGEVPAPQHVAFIELVLAAVALRRHTDQADRHASFLILGPTLRWKSSCAEFLATALGVDPTLHITDLRAERGQSLWIRRGPDGEILTQRDLLTAPIAIFDEYQAADAAVRRAVGPFLIGRRRLPIENDIVSLAPVPVVIMNPAPGATLPARTTFSEAQLRRMVPLDVASLAMPDLALVGRRAIVAAQTAGPLTVPTPRGSVEMWREHVVNLVRASLTAEGQKLVDIEMLLGLGRGMSAWFPPPAALRHVLYNLHLVVETVGWTKPGWVNAVRTFPHGTAAPSMRTVHADQTASPHTGSSSIVLYPERVPSVEAKNTVTTPRDSIIPMFTLSYDAKLDLSWLCRELGCSADAAIAHLVGQHRMLRSEGHEVEDLRAIVHLRNACAEAQVSVAELHDYLELRAALKRHGISVAEVRDVAALGAALDAAGVSWEQAREVADVIAALEKAGIDVAVVENLRVALGQFASLGVDPIRLTPLAKLWERLQERGLTVDTLGGTLNLLDRLNALGLDEQTADALAGMLDAAGVRTGDRGAVLKRSVDVGCTEGDRLRLQQQLAAARNDLTLAQEALREAEGALRAVSAEIEQTTQKRDVMRAEIAILDEEGAARHSALVTADALMRLLLSQTTLHHPVWRILEQILQLKRSQRPVAETTAVRLTSEVRQHIRGLLEQMVEPEASEDEASSALA